MFREEASPNWLCWECGEQATLIYTFAQSPDEPLTLCDECDRAMVTLARKREVPDE